VTLLTVWLATTTLSTAVSGAFGAVGQIGEATASAVSGVASDADEMATGSPVLSDERQQVTEAGQQRQSVMRSIRQEARELYRQAVSEEQRRQAAEAVEETARDVVRTPGDIGQDINQLVDRLFAADGIFSEADRQEAVDLLQQRLGITDEEANQIVQNWQDRYQAAVSQVDQALEELRQEAVQTAQEAADAVGAAAGWTALALALGLVAAVIGGMLGKPEPWMLEAAEEEERTS
jgi:CHASE3 domain sensor protein